MWILPVLFSFVCWLLIWVYLWEKEREDKKDKETKLEDKYKIWEDYFIRYSWNYVVVWEVVKICYPYVRFLYYLDWHFGWKKTISLKEDDIIKKAGF